MFERSGRIHRIPPDQSHTQKEWVASPIEKYQTWQKNVYVTLSSPLPIKSELLGVRGSPPERCRTNLLASIWKIKRTLGMKSLLCL